MTAEIRGIGIDTEENERIAALIEKSGERFLEKVFTHGEIGYCSVKNDNYGSFTARFCAKEALFKALGSGLRDGLKWKDVETLNDELGKPYIRLYGKAAERIGDDRVHVSLTHTRNQAAAFVIIERRCND
jgi:holo-[acyl-carrier protein] synthase